MRIDKGRLWPAIIGSSLGLALGLTTGCDRSTRLEGVVLEEGGTLPRLVKSPKGFLSNETVKINNSYVLTVQTAQGKYTMAVRDDYKKPVAALEEAIEKGDTIIFPLTNYNGQTIFFEDNIGAVNSNEISVKKK